MVSTVPVAPQAFTADWIQLFTVWQIFLSSKLGLEGAVRGVADYPCRELFAPSSSLVREPVAQRFGRAIGGYLTAVRSSRAPLTELIRGDSTMLIGVPKEIKDREYRVGLTAASMRELGAPGHSVPVQQDARIRC